MAKTVENQKQFLQKHADPALGRGQLPGQGLVGCPEHLRTRTSCPNRLPRGSLKLKRCAGVLIPPGGWDVRRKKARVCGAEMRKVGYILRISNHTNPQAAGPVK